MNAVTEGRSVRWLGVYCGAVAALALGWVAMDDVGFRDSGEIGTAAQVLGVAHPTGFALDMLLLKLAGFLPLGHLAWRQNLAVAMLAAVALGVLSQLTCEIALRAGASARSAVWGAVLSACALGCWATFLGTARVVEVYSSALLAVGLAAFALLRGRVPLFALIAGLCAGLHATAALYVGVLGLLAVLLSPRGLARWRGAWLPFAVGALVLAYLPLASLRDPPLDWGDPQTPARLFAHLTAARIRGAYAGQMFGGEADLAPVELMAQLAQLWPVLALSALGIAWIGVRARHLAWPLLVLLVADLAYGLWLNPMGIVDRQVGHASGAVLCLLAGLGAAAALERLSGLAARPRTAASLALTTALCGIALARTDASVLADGHAASELLGSGGALSRLPARAVAICSTDDECAAGLFALHVERVRPDISLAPAQHLWDPTVVRQLEGLSLRQEGRPEPGPGGRRALANARVRALALATRRPVFWNDAAPLRAAKAGRPIPAAIGAYLKVVPSGGDGAWPRGAVAQLDRDRLARLPEGRARHPWARAAWAHAYSTLGVAAIGTRQSRLGVAALREATRIAPERATSWTNLGVALETLGDLQGAIESSMQAIRVAPRSPTPWVNLARLELKREDRARATAVVEAARRAGISDPRLAELARELGVEWRRD